MINFSTVPETNKKYIDTMIKKKEKRRRVSAYL
jgi:hypothetical protein